MSVAGSSCGTRRYTDVATVRPLSSVSAVLVTCSGRLRTLCLTVMFVSLVASGCANSGTDTSEAGSPTTARSEHGSHMAPPQVKVSQVVRSGSGPAVGDDWRAWIALNVCGQFLEPTAAEPVRGIRPLADGTVEISPRDPADAGADAVIGSYVEAVSAQLSTGSLTLPDDVEPAAIEVRGTPVDVAGRTFTDGDECGDVPGKVAVWVYSPEAVRTGNGLVTVVEDPQNVPFIADGMAIVITFTPESSLPTLPPAAAVVSIDG